MADLGETSEAGTAHKHKVTSWITVLLVVAASITLGLAFVLRSIPLTVIGGVLLVAGVAMGLSGRIMDDAY